MYLRASGPRALFQGDVYRDVPFTKVGAGNSPDHDPQWSARRSYVAPILYPCDIVDRDNVTPIRAQPIVRVYDAAAAGLRVSEVLDEVPIAVCPLPDLNGDGTMWVADFRTISVVDRSYLTENRRVRCLSEYGWAIFRQRLGTSSTRAEVNLDVVLELGAGTWAESEMEARWVEHVRERRGFHEWLDEPRSGDYTTFRHALEEGALQFVRVELEAELSD